MTTEKLFTEVARSHQLKAIVEEPWPVISRKPAERTEEKNEQEVMFYFYYYFSLTTLYTFSKIFQPFHFLIFPISFSISFLCFAKETFEKRYK